MQDDRPAFVTRRDLCQRIAIGIALENPRVGPRRNRHQKVPLGLRSWLHLGGRPQHPVHFQGNFRFGVLPGFDRNPVSRSGC